jgi:hypothetical protein
MTTQETLSAYIKQHDATEFDIACAVYWYLTFNHNGQGSKEYSLLCAVSKIYNPGASECGPEADSVCETIYNDIQCRDNPLFLLGIFVRALSADTND